MFNEKQIENWKAYEGVRQSGEINMWHARIGCQITGMEQEEWLFCIKHYDELRKQAEEQGEDYERVL
jgi:hypothetical protein